MTLTDFLLARIAEDEAAARDAASFPGGDRVMATLPTALFAGLRPGFPARVLAECEAKRDIVREHVGYGGICGTCGVRKPDTGERWPCRTLRLLGFPYADHPDYREEWRP